LKIEFVKATKQLLRPVSSTFDPTNREATERDIRTLNRQLGQIDPRLLPGEQTLDPTGLVDVYSLTRFGRAGNFDESAVKDLIEKLGLTTSIERAGAGPLSFIQESSRSLFADPEESDDSTVGLISEFDEASCQRAREVLDQLPWVMTKGSLIPHDLGLNWASNPNIYGPHVKLAARALFQPEFRITIFTQLVVGIRQGNTDGIFGRALMTRVRNLRDQGRPAGPPEGELG
jgi:hypothetical protein